MKLNELLESVTTPAVSGAGDPDIKGIAYDSRQVKPGWMFIAVPGERTDGADFISEAISKGAAAVVSESSFEPGAGVVHIQVPRARRALAEIANAYFGDLSRRMKVIGITGTNGKTTTAHMIRDILRDGGFLPGLLGTVAYEVGEHVLPASRTTPEAPDLHSMFQQMHEHGCDSAVMEVSSHALALDRVHGIDFAISVFTNLTQDHLDFHRTMEAYFDAKARLFRNVEQGADRSAVINLDDAWGARLAEDPSIAGHVLTYGFDDRAQVCASHVAVDLHGTRFKVSTPWGKGRVHLRLLGRFNIHNALAAIAAGGLCRVDLKRMIRTLENIDAIPGRLELAAHRKGRRIFVDYAHTEDALENVLSTLREICKGRLILVFGCGGDRDPGKRPKMGAAAGALADYTIVTSDNPRTEVPGAIAGDIIQGFDDPDRFEVVLDRRNAIAQGIRLMGRNDMLLVAGKGHETYQELDGTIVPFSDKDVIGELVG
ncbi:MAG TPA: UDP-N-acetylmuramoyl-L-alanyl-D-glutamate--2,6-diaminopimelate ligase [Pontiella sp.]|nr:UDP-N-acetylmuramoyl-L-alanyl-D-glutamate--2,6-diaminopimelate ligase [Pontiella sp.]